MKGRVGRRSNRARDPTKGMVALLALLVLLTITSVSLVAAQGAVNHMARAGAFRFYSIASGVTDAGLDTVMATAAKDPVAFVQLVEANNNQLSMADLAPDLFDTGSMGSFGREYSQVQGVDFVATFTNPEVTNRAPGYQVGQYQFKKYRVYIDGVYGSDVSGNPDDVLRHSQRRTAITIFVGPLL